MTTTNALASTLGFAAVAATASAAVTPVPTAKFLDSIGIVTTFPDRGQPIEKTIEMVKYCGFRWVRGGIEGVSDNGPTTVDTYLQLHKATGVKFSCGLVSGGSDIQKCLAMGRRLAAANALLAFEGNNEPNNWGVTYQGEKGGGHGSSTWVPLAKLQRDFYAAVKADPLLRNIPVWSPSEMGAEPDNVGLQFLVIPEGADTVMPAGTRYADFLNVHNYIYHPSSAKLTDNKAWNAADPTPACRIDGLWGNHGSTWAKHFKGYSEEEILTVPRVTTESGTTIGGEVTEEIHGLHLVNFYLAQFKRGWSYTSPYLLRDRTDEGGNQKFGFYAPDYTPRPAATYVHNLTTILADKGRAIGLAPLAYTIPDCPETTHDLLLRHSSGKYQLVVWAERVSGSDNVKVVLERPVNVTVYDVKSGTAPVAKLTAVKEIPLELTDHPVVLVF